MTAEGLRVLAVAERDSARMPPEGRRRPRRWRGSASRVDTARPVGLADTPRASAQTLLKELDGRDIGVRLITVTIRSPRASSLTNWVSRSPPSR